MDVAVIGCGYVADFYARNAQDHPELILRGAFDHSPDRTKAFCERFGAKSYGSLIELLDDDSIPLVLNLTNPRSHFDITKACLDSGKHVYSEKPLAMEPHAAANLMALARERGLRLASAPCSVLGNTAQTVWKAINDGAIGKTRLIYANYDEGLIRPDMAPWNWTSETGAHWPAQDEFEIGCTYEHAGYVLTWLAAFFGPVRSMTSHASIISPDKGISVENIAPDFSVGCLEYDDGVVAKVTCGLAAPHDKSFLVVGDAGHLYVNDLRNDTAPVFIRKLPLRGGLGFTERALQQCRRWTRLFSDALPWPKSEWRLYNRYPDALGAPPCIAGPGKPVDFMRGVKDLIEAIENDRPHRLSAELGVHIVELIEALQYPDRVGHHKSIETTFPRMAPLRWR